MKLPTEFTTKTGKVLTIRQPLLSDAASALSFINALSKEQTFITMQGEQQTLKNEQKYLRNMLKKIKKHETVQLLALDGDKVVANTSIELGIRVNHHVGTFSIAIADGYRDIGLGSILMQLLFEYAKENLSSLKIIELRAFANNERAKHVYEKLGFVEYGRLPGGVLHKDEYIDEILMYKKV